MKRDFIVNTGRLKYLKNSSFHRNIFQMYRSLFLNAKDSVEKPKNAGGAPFTVLMVASSTQLKCVESLRFGTGLPLEILVKSQVNRM